MPQPAPADPVDWALAQASDDEDDAPVPDAPLEPELIEMPPASGIPPMSSLERYASKQMPLAPHLSVSRLSRVSVVSCVLARTRVSMP